MKNSKEYLKYKKSNDLLSAMLKGHHDKNLLELININIDEWQALWLLVKPPKFKKEYLNGRLSN